MRFAVSGQRVAPTQKIADDASFPQRPIGPGAGSAVPVTAPGVVAPRAIPAAPFLPPPAPAAPRPLAGGSAAPARAAAAQPLAPAPRPLSRPPPSRPPAVVVDDPRDATRPWALIAVVLLIDLGLAAAGIWMLVQGLGDRASRPVPARSGALTAPLRDAS